MRDRPQQDRRQLGRRATAAAIFAAVLALSCDLWLQPALAEESACHGRRQSPVDLGGAQPMQGAALEIDYMPFSAELAHDGHTVEVGPSDGAAANGLTLGGVRFDFVQFHFHHPSEHALAGKRWPMEMHLVHRAADGRLAVLGVMLRPGRENDGLATLLDALPPRGGVRPLAKPLDLGLFLPSNAAHFSYEGSLTTPPCSEIVSWIVFRDPIEAGVGQIASLARSFPTNARPLQPVAGRSIGLDLF